MRALACVHRWLGETQTFSHASRVRALTFAVTSLLVGGVLTLTGLGRAHRSPVAPKHRIKRIDRLLGNPRLHAEIDKYLGWLSGQLLRRRPRPIILVDWTELSGGRYALSAALAFSGQSIPLCWMVRRQGLVGNAHTQRKFLRRLQAVLPEGCRPVVVTDAGFYSRWFRDVTALGWDYVGRVRGKTACRFEGEDWVSSVALFERATLRPTDLGWATVSKTQPYDGRLVLVRRRRKPGPKKKRATAPRRPGPPKKSERKRGLSLTEQRDKHRLAAEEPWLLVTSLDEDAHQIVGHYKCRMQIEESFRLMKTTRFGWALASARTTSAKRWEVLLLIATLAIAFTTVVGAAVEAAGLQGRYQANTVKNRRTLAVPTLGWMAINDPYLPELVRVGPRALQALPSP